ncbi:MAG TPA: glycosyltransferase family A protein [Chthoniobacterales bacterium]|nr:glycosyltransferase family A protein [Chthoniobacterales bacterium]
MRNRFCEDGGGKNPELVSVIIPAFNAARNIRQTLDSVRVQTYQSFEVIVVDDGSTDDTCAVVGEFVQEDSRFYLVRQENRGVGDARNAGIRKARGQYIAPLDADDLWYPEKLEKQVARLAHCGPETGLVYCWSDLTDERGELMEHGDQYKFEGRLDHVLVLTCILGNASVPLFRRAALEKVGPYLTRAEQHGAQGCEDWDLALRVAERFNIGVVPEYLLAYRQSGSSMSVDTESMATSYTLTMGRARQRNRHVPSALFRWSAGYFSFYLLNKCYHWGDYSRCLRYLMDATRANPFLLLRTEVYRKLAECLFRLATRQIPNHLLEQVQPALDKKAKEAALRSKREGKPLFFSNRIFRKIEERRWSAALRNRALG